MKPDGWSISDLGDIFEFKNGINADKSKYGHGVKFVNIMEVLSNDSLAYEDIRGLVEIDEKTFESYSVKYGDVLLNRTSETQEEIGLAAVYLDTKPVVFGGFVIRARPTSKNIVPEFSKYCFKSYAIRKQIMSLGQGGIRANIGQGDLKNVKLILPSQQEQVKISEILSTWDQACKVLKNLLAKKIKLKAALNEKHLLRFQKNKKVKFSDIFVRVNEKNIINNGNVLTISAQRGLINQERYFNKNVASKNLSNYTIIKKGDFTYNKSYSNGYPLGAIKPLENYEHGVVSPLYICFRLKTFSPELFSYFKHFFEAGAFDTQIKSIAQEGARNHGLLNVSVVDFFKLDLPLVDLDKIQKISSCFDSLDKDIDLTKKLLENIKIQRQGIMQQLLSGQIRVKV